MFKRAVWSVVALLVASSIAILVFAQAQGQQAKGQNAPGTKLPGNLPGVFTFIPKADVEKVQTAIENGLPNDAPVRMVNVSNRFNLGVYTLNSRPSKPPAPGTPVVSFVIQSNQYRCVVALNVSAADNGLDDTDHAVGHSPTGAARSSE